MLEHLHTQAQLDDRVDALQAALVARWRKSVSSFARCCWISLAAATIGLSWPWVARQHHWCEILPLQHTLHLAPLGRQRRWPGQPQVLGADELRTASVTYAHTSR